MFLYRILVEGARQIRGKAPGARRRAQGAMWEVGGSLRSRVEAKKSGLGAGKTKFASFSSKYLKMNYNRCKFI
jgi:hypothetical protein